MIGTGERFVQILTLVLILGFPVIVLFAWAYERTPEGLRPTSHVDKSKSITADTGRKLNYIVLILFVIAAIVLAAIVLILFVIAAIVLAAENVL